MGHIWWVLAGLLLLTVALLAATSSEADRRGALVVAGVGLAVVVGPLLAAALGEDFWLFRNLIVAWIPFVLVLSTALTGRAGPRTVAVGAAAIAVALVAAEGVLAVRLRSPAGSDTRRLARLRSVPRPNAGPTSSRCSPGAQRDRPQLLPPIRSAGRNRGHRQRDHFRRPLNAQRASASRLSADGLHVQFRASACSRTARRSRAAFARPASARATRCSSIDASTERALANAYRPTVEQAQAASKHQRLSRVALVCASVRNDAWRRSSLGSRRGSRSSNSASRTCERLPRASRSRYGQRTILHPIPYGSERTDWRRRMS